jgi:hypothetical protein
VTLDGLPRWEKWLSGPIRGGTAGDTGSGALFVSLEETRIASYLNLSASIIATGIGAYAVDEGRYPPTGDLEPLLIPPYLRCFPSNFFAGRPATWSSTPFPGDYDYSSSPDGLSYEFAFWDEEGNRVAVYRDDICVSPTEDRPPSVASFDSDGNQIWLTSVGAMGVEITPLTLTAAGTVVFGTSGGEVVALESSDGEERWRTPVGGSFLTAAAVLPDNGVVFVNGAGDVSVLDPEGSVRWTFPTRVAPGGAPTTTADGLIYVPGLDGILRFFESSGGPPTLLDLGDGGLAGLSTSTVQSEGWIYTGRTDGAVVALVPRSTYGRPEDPGAVLFATGEKGAVRVGFAWEGAALPNIPGAHFHLLRWSDIRFGTPEQILLPHPSAVTLFSDTGAAGNLLFYRLRAADCGENESVESW